MQPSREETASGADGGNRRMRGQSPEKMQGANLSKLILVRCRVCGTWVAIRLDPEDLNLHIAGVFVQHAFPYLAPASRELLISSVCPDCWAVFCPSNKLAYN